MCESPIQESGKQTAIGLTPNYVQGELDQQTIPRNRPVGWSNSGQTESDREKRDAL